ncbi:hypothetical protein B296_00012862 [Ensete ventricosum]|uniref:Uncharacterized protein n=1 Tax=Ensete ventricosum TaxID=4639 RepID=A0A426YN33_ENSVE|nr:hypothetical protein B296_00012862 [Ensete ventricosum]
MPISRYSSTKKKKKKKKGLKARRWSVLVGFSRTCILDGRYEIMTPVLTSLAVENEIMSNGWRHDPAS